MKNLLTVQLASVNFLSEEHHRSLDKAAKELDAEVIVVGREDTVSLTANPAELYARIDQLVELVGQLVLQNAQIVEALIMGEGEEESVGFGSMSNKR